MRPQAPHAVDAAQDLASSLRPGLNMREVRSRIGLPNSGWSRDGGTMWVYFCRDGRLEIDFTRDRVRRFSIGPP